MHARVTTFKIKPGEWEASQEDRGIAEKLVQQKGFKGAYALANPEAGKQVSITLWESEADMKATEDSGWYQEALEIWADTYEDAPVSEHYRVFFEL